MAEDAPHGMETFTRAVGSTIEVIGDDFLVTSAKRIQAAASAGQCNAVLINQSGGTMTESIQAWDVAKRLWCTIVSARSGETEDVMIAHFATGWNAGQL
ncbi:MAG: eno [Gammaproteobacteria bacterium]|nr:eno [Gammaproteobacteria bacterium]